MVKSKKIIPIDIFSIKEFGVEKWHKNFEWPVSLLEFNKIEKDVNEILEIIIKDSDYNLKKSMHVLYPIILPTVSLMLNSKLVIDRLSNSNVIFNNYNHFFTKKELKIFILIMIFLISKTLTFVLSL